MKIILASNFSPDGRAIQGVPPGNCREEFAVLFGRWGVLVDEPALKA
jgi:hypothetical protein